MRLLNVETLELSEFFEDDIPPYGILSHRWGKEEVSYQDFIQGRNKDRDGFRKIRELCSFIHKREVFFLESSPQQPNTDWDIISGTREETPKALQWVWVDTCCIDKSSSAELSEAINSMYNWYSAAEECYVYLSDLPSLGEHSMSQARAAFERSEWFTRGWTLQELLAPRVRVFCTSTWDIFGYTFREALWSSAPLAQKCHQRLQSRTWKDIYYLERYYKTDLSSSISRVTGIQMEYLDGSFPVHSASVARRMSWASRRRTTRTEDMAYCLFGIFDVNMPLLYGERSKAFYRLQEEIIKRSDDQSIFAWNYFSPGPNASILAPHVECFKLSGMILRGQDRPEHPYSVTNVGLYMKIELRGLATQLLDPSCILHVLELQGIRLASSAPESNLKLYLLQCLHDPRKLWYRSGINDFFMGNTRHTSIPFKEGNEPQQAEIFAALHAGQFCVMCASHDSRLTLFVDESARQDRLAQQGGRVLDATEVTTGGRRAESSESRRNLTHNIRTLLSS